MFQTKIAARIRIYIHLELADLLQNKTITCVKRIKDNIINPGVKILEMKSNNEKIKYV